MTSEFPEPPEPVDLSTLKSEDAMPGEHVRPNAQKSQNPPPLTKLFTPRPRSEKPKQKPPTPAMPKAGYIAGRLEELYIGMSMMLYPMDQVCAEAVAKSAPDCAKAMEELCKENHAVRRVVLKLIETSTVGKVIMAHLPILMMVATHHVPMFQSFAGKVMADNVEDSLKNAANQNGSEGEQAA